MAWGGDDVKGVDVTFLVVLGSEFALAQQAPFGSAGNSGGKWRMGRGGKGAVAGLDGRRFQIAPSSQVICDRA